MLGCDLRASRPNLACSVKIAGTAKTGGFLFASREVEMFTAVGKRLCLSSRSSGGTKNGEHFFRALGCGERELPKLLYDYVTTQERVSAKRAQDVWTDSTTRKRKMKWCGIRKIFYASRHKPPVNDYLTMPLVKKIGSTAFKRILNVKLIIKIIFSNIKKDNIFLFYISHDDDFENLF